MYTDNFSPMPMGPNYNSPLEMYAHGGHTGHGLRHDAQMLRHYGMGRDKILAHLNPSEVSYLAHHHGMSHNPYTGLPQFGLWDMLKTVGGAVGNAALQNAPSLWAEYGQPLAQSALQSMDTRIQNALPGMGQALGQKLGGQRFGETFGNIGKNFGNRLAGQYENYGGMAGQFIPRINQAMGVQGPAQFPQVGRSTPMNAGRNIGTGMWNETFQPMAQNALQRADVGIANRMANIPGVGGAMSEAWRQTPGVSGYVSPRMQQAASRFQAPQGAYAHGGYVHHHNPYMGGHDMMSEHFYSEPNIHPRPYM